MKKIKVNIIDLKEIKSIKVRKEVFETNSSSSHSLTIVDLDLKLSLTPIEEVYKELDLEIYPNNKLPKVSFDIQDNKLIIGRDGKTEFGWEEEESYDFDSKVNYAALISKNDDNQRDMLTEVLLEASKASEVDYSILENQEGYIDHQSNDNDEMFSSKEKLISFLFNPLSCVITDNDNH